MRKFYALFALAAILGGSGCSGASSSDYPSANPRVAEIPIRPKLTPRIEFHCDNDRKFVFTLVTGGRASLTFFDTSTVEVLDENRIERGTEYANTRYILHEHAGAITLTDLSEDHAKPVRCLRIPWE